MKKIDLTKQLKLLQQIQPSSKVMEDIGKKINLNIKGVELNLHENHGYNHSNYFFNSSKSQRSWVYTAAFTVIVLVFIGFSSPFSDFSKKLAYTARVAIASNQYKKAQITVEFTKSQNLSLDLNSKNHNSGEINKFSKMLAIADTQLSELYLMGEKGKYTKEQCKQIYQEFHSYLEDENKYISTIIVDKENEKEISHLKAKIIEYKERAENKLELY